MHADGPVDDLRQCQVGSGGQVRVSGDALDAKVMLEEVQRIDHGAAHHDAEVARPPGSDNPMGIQCS